MGPPRLAVARSRRAAERIEIGADAKSDGARAREERGSMETFDTSNAFPGAVDLRGDGRTVSKPPALQRWFDAWALNTYPLVARVFGYQIKVGADESLERDAKTVHRAVWSEKGLLPPDELASFGRRYDDATTWVVAYHRGKPVGVIGLLDLRIASINLDFESCLMPEELDLATTRELGRLAILPEHRGGAQLVMAALLLEMVRYCYDNEIETLFSGSVRRLFAVFARYNPSARLIVARPDPVPNAERDRYFEKLRAYGRGDSVLYTFKASKASPFAVFSELLRSLARGEKAAQ
jgi:hypothetical protein